MSATGDVYRSLDDVVAQLQQDFRASPATFRLALSISGGGAKGAWGQGVLEALKQEMAKQGANFPVSLLCGTSAGALVCFGEWVNTVFPAPAPPAPLLSRASGLWSQLAVNNDAAQRLVSPAVVLELASGKHAIPIVSDILTRIGDLDTDITKVKTRFQRAATDLAALSASLGQLGLTDLANDLSQLASDLATDVGKVAKVVGDIVSLDISAIADAIGLATTAQQQLGTVQNELAQLANDVANLPTTVPAVLRDLGQLAVDVGGLGTAALATTGDLALLVIEVAALVAALEVLMTFLTTMVTFAPVAAAAGATTAMVRLALTENVLSNTGIHDTLLGFLGASTALRRSRNVDQDARARWHATTSRRGRLPELLVTGTDVSAGRLAVFAVAQTQTVQQLSSSGLWVVDLLNDQRPAPTGWNVLVPSPTPNDALVKAVVTSTSLPVAFPTADWGLHFTGRNTQTPSGLTPTGPQTGVFHHRFVDGGVADNSPIDIAVSAGASHVLSIELSPLGAWTYDLPAHDIRSPRTMLNVYSDSFDASMQACIASGLRPIVANHVNRPRVFRIGPRVQSRIPGKDRPDQTIGGLDTLDFDGAYAPAGTLRLNLYDGFMQGYLEARHFASTAAANADPMVVDYQDHTKHAGSIRNVPASTRNQFWEVGAMETPPTEPG